ncbi:unnamed protein product [Bemisia tabaci]|uniref:GTP:AMP phosphotransferase, mitochondrial n=1 Tax=Bemisia tabaci TaxID=7038 RepID=A0A9P0F7X0_BEMTA|nr:PREDICTED: GTP:AMP phosphotransferase AK3, mitochondrial [Bemisia tabaci]CAH0396160.1 unnamed protein product [Bemisia tabaci]
MIRQFRSLVLGAPGSGKGTISSRIVKSFDLTHISSGDIFRHHIANKTEVGKQIESILKSGSLVPDDLTLKVITQELQKHSQKNWLLDGFPRTKVQAIELNKTTPIDLVINLVVPFDIIIDRLSKRWIHAPSGRVYNLDFNPPKEPGLDDVTGEKLTQRSDDTPESVRKRLEIYTDKTKPVSDYYRELGVLMDFEGNTSDEIWPHVHDALSGKLPKKEASRSTA